MKITQWIRKVCPNCGERDTRRSARCKRLDYFLMALLFFPYRCRTCGIRFRRFA